MKCPKTGLRIRGLRKAYYEYEKEKNVKKHSA